MNRSFLAVAIFACACSSTNVDNGPADASASNDAAPTDASVQHEAEAAVLPPGDWSCLGNVPQRTPTAATAAVHFNMVEPVQGMPVAGVAVKVCTSLADTTCGDAGAPATSDSNGVVDLTVPLGTKGFAGYFDCAVTNDVTILNVVLPPFAADVPMYQRVQWSAAAFQVVFNTTSGIEWHSTTHGLIGFEVHDCGAYTGVRPNVAAGVTVEVTSAAPSAKTGYIDTKSSKIDTTRTSTDKSGLGGVVDIPAGMATIRWKLAATGQTLGQIAVPVRVGVATMVTLPPLM